MASKGIEVRAEVKDHKTPAPWTTEWANKTTVQQLADEKLMKLNDLQSLMDAQSKYVKFRCESNRENYMLNLNAYLSLKDDKSTIIKVSTYHDLREVRYLRNEKDLRSPGATMTKLMVMGTQMKEESWDGDKYCLRYWMIFEVQPQGAFKQETEWKEGKSFSDSFVKISSDPKAKPPQNFKYLLVNQSKKNYKNLVIREEKQMMFQVNYHIRDWGKDSVPVADDPSHTPNIEAYLYLYQNAWKLSNEIQDIHSMDYPNFLEAMKKTFEGPNCDNFCLKRLDCFVI